MRYALDVQYRGKFYAGSQIQFENGKDITEPTIQGELERALCTLINAGRCKGKNDESYDNTTTKSIKPGTDIGQINKQNRLVKTIFSGRTDKGVNALGQVVHFDTDKEIVASSFIYHINEILPSDISVNNLRIVPDSFHAQKSAKSR